MGGREFVEGQLQSLRSQMAEADALHLRDRQNILQFHPINEVKRIVGHMAIAGWSALEKVMR